MRTYAYCLAHGLTVWVGCRACALRVEVQGLAPDLHGYRVEELQRMGAIGCPTCGRPAMASIMGTWWNYPRELECWSDIQCHYVPPTSEGVDA